MTTALCKLQSRLTKKIYSALFVRLLDEHKVYVCNRQGYQPYPLPAFVHLQDYLEEIATHLVGIKPVANRSRIINRLLGIK